MKDMVLHFPKPELRADTQRKCSFPGWKFAESLNMELYAIVAKGKEFVHLSFRSELVNIILLGTKQTGIERKTLASKPYIR